MPLLMPVLTRTPYWVLKAMTLADRPWGPLPPIGVLERDERDAVALVAERPLAGLVRADEVAEHLCPARSR